MSTVELLAQCKAVLSRHYGKQFKGLLLYGTAARGTPAAESDIDLLVLLDEPFDYFDELRQIVELVYPVQLESERLISAKPAALHDFETGAIQLYRNARREGAFV